MKSRTLPGDGNPKRRAPRRHAVVDSAVVDRLENRVLLSGTLSSYAAFNGTDGEAPVAAVEDSQGNLFGVTSYSTSGSTTKSGVLFEIPATNTGTGQIVDLATLGNGSGIVQGTSLIIDSAGNLFGTENGGPADGGCTVFEVKQGTSTITPLATFPAAGDGGVNASQGTLTAVDSSGNVYGVDDFGNAFEVAAGSGTISDMAGAYGVSQLQFAPKLGPDGNFYGFSQGSIIELVTATHTVKTLAAFDQAEGSGPLGITLDSNGNLWGISQYGPGGSQVGNGTVWELPVGQNTISLISTFSSATGSNPISAPVFGTSGNLYGLASSGGANQFGTLFEIPGVGSTPAGAVAPTTTPVDLADLDTSDAGTTGDGIVTDSAGQSIDSTPTTMSSLADDRLVLGAVGDTGTVPGVIVYGPDFGRSGQATVLSSGGIDKLTPQFIKKQLNDYRLQVGKKAFEMGMKENDERDFHAKEIFGRALVAGVSGLGSSQTLVGSFSDQAIREPSMQATNQGSYSAALTAINVTLNLIGTELNVVSRDLSQQARYVAPFNKLGTVITSLTTQLAAQTNSSAKARTQAKITADQNAQDNIYNEDTAVYNATGALEDTIDSQLSGITTAFADLPALVVTFSGSVMAVPKSVVPGKRAVFVLTVINSGNVGAAGPLAIALSARPAGTSGEADIALPSVTVKIRIRAGVTAPEQISVVIPTTLAAGSYSLVAQLDPDNAYSESMLPSVIVSTQTFTVAG